MDKDLTLYGRKIINAFDEIRPFSVNDKEIIYYESKVF